MDLILFIITISLILAFLGIFFSILKFLIILDAISLIIFGCAIIFEIIVNPFVMENANYTPFILILIGIVLLKIFI